MKSIDIKGLDLKIDLSIQKICEASNATSSSTRSILYFLVIVNILSLCAVLNSHVWNWTETRVYILNDSISFYKNKTENAHSYADSLKYVDKVVNLQKKSEMNIRNQIDNYQTVRIPILGNSFDINNLGIISGITFILLITILRFSLSREINNVKIAFNSIAERYSNASDREEFETKIKTINIQEAPEDILSSINYTRRQYHYNYLSMNEIFNMPPLKYFIQDYTGIKFYAVTYMFYFPTLVYLAIFSNDLMTINYGIRLSPVHTLISSTFSVICLIIITIQCKACTLQKKRLFELYRNFRNRDYNFMG